jgi:uncharacterized membrane protein YdjX (TVP38/TMEM64 family)
VAEKLARGTKNAGTANRWLKLAVLVLFAGGIAAFFSLGGRRYATLETLKANREALLDFTRMHYVPMVLIACAVYTASTALSLPGGLVLSLAAGFLFGRWVGTAIIVFSATLGATLVFLAARYLFADAARARMAGLAEKINRGFTADSLNYLLFLRLVPVFPFWLVNLAPAFTGIRLSTYVLGTAVGIVPGSFVFANLGQSLGRIDSLKGLLSKETLTAFALLGLIALLPVLYRKLRGRRSGAAGPAP